jgi:hypothetical protein
MKFNAMLSRHDQTRESAAGVGPAWVGSRVGSEGGKNGRSPADSRKLSVLLGWPHHNIHPAADDKSTLVNITE